MTDKSSPVTNGKKIRLITQVLTTAIKLWLRTQLTQVSQIEVEIGSSDRQLLSGCIPSVSIFATNAVYQGVHVTRVQLWAENIRLNIGAILKGKPLKLLEVVPVVAELLVEEQDLNNSLSSELLSTALNDVLVKLLPEECQKSKPIAWQEITLDNQRLILFGVLLLESEPTVIEISMGLELLNGQELQLSQIQIKSNQEIIGESNSKYHLDLGSDVDIKEITFTSSQLVCHGRINVNP
ncbi:LmeA family phospholipid-binding protein [Anabaena sp. WFMT]|uniref:LmeA family phospholipid-binding protein n=1 Tax=Anabaena sp. WFMT TaxID=3449730 RepID=UPI003F26C639